MIVASPEAWTKISVIFAHLHLILCDSSVRKHLGSKRSSTASSRSPSSKFRLVQTTKSLAWHKTFKTVCHPCCVHIPARCHPKITTQASPLGLSGLAGELPGLISSLRGALLKAMSKKIVEPNRKVLDVQKIYRSKFVAKVSLRSTAEGVAGVSARSHCPS